MKYANTDKAAVITNNLRTQQQWSVPRGHRFWHEWGIDKAENEGRISESETMATTGDADGGVIAG